MISKKKRLIITMCIVVPLSAILYTIPTFKTINKQKMIDITNLDLQIQGSDSLTEEVVLQAVKNKTNANITLENDLDVKITKSDFGIAGKAVISAKQNSIYIEGTQTLDWAAKDKMDITNLDLQIQGSDSLTEEVVLQAVKNKTNANVTLENDLDVQITKSDFGIAGKAVISAKQNSIYIEGTQTLDWAAKDKMDITNLDLQIQGSDSLTEEVVLQAVKNKTNANVTLENDLDVQITKSDFGIAGKAVISAKQNSIYIEGTQTLDWAAKDKMDITNLDLQIQGSDSLTEEVVLQAVKNKTNANVTLENDLDVQITKSDFGIAGKAVISAKQNSIYIEGTQTLDWAAKDKMDITNLDLQIQGSDSLTEEVVLQAVKNKTNANVTLENDLDVQITKSDFGIAGKAVISAKQNSIYIEGTQTLDWAAKDKMDITNLDLQIQGSDSLTEEDVLTSLKKLISTKLTLNDFDFEILNIASSSKKGKAEIKAVESSVYIEGTQVIEWEYMVKPVDLSTLLSRFVPSTNTSKSDIQRQLNSEIGGQPYIEQSDFDFSISIKPNKSGSIRITSWNQSKLFGYKDLKIPIDISSFEDIKDKVSKDSMQNNKTEILKILRERASENTLTENDFDLYVTKSINNGETIIAGSIQISGKNNLSGSISFPIYVTGNVTLSNLLSSDRKDPNRSSSVFYSKDLPTMKTKISEKIAKNLGYGVVDYWYQFISLYWGGNTLYVGYDGNHGPSNFSGPNGNIKFPTDSFTLNY